MGAPKGKTHRHYTAEEKLSYITACQESHVSQALINAIDYNRLHHAYLFTGTRGVGKTTIARILSKCLNCDTGITSTPCGVCDNCVAIDQGRFIDLIEIDAASRTKVEDTRELLDNVPYAPSQGRYKVYLIDEVHMLSISAFNALLKIIEEPPEHLLFILATTEVHKLPATILSRCQRFDFRRILISDIVNRLTFIAKEENINLTTDAAELIARIADGGMRDALSLLDQCIAYSTDVDASTVSFAAGIAGREYLFDVLEFIFNKQPAKCIDILNELYSMSKDLQTFCKELLEQMRNLMLIKSIPENIDILSCLNSERERLLQIANKVSLSDIIDKMEILQQTNERLTKAVSKRVEVEMCLVKLCSDLKVQAVATPQTSTDNADIEALNLKLLALEKAVASGSIQKAQPTVTQIEENPLVPEANAPIQPDEPLRIDIKKLSKDVLKELNEWPDVVEKFSGVAPSLSGALDGSRAFYYEEDGQSLLIIYYENSFFGSLFKSRDKAALLFKTVTECTGKSFYIKTKCIKGAQDNAQSPINQLLNKAKDADVEVKIN